MLNIHYWIRKFAIMVVEGHLTKQAFFNYCQQHHAEAMTMKYHRPVVASGYESFNLIREYQGEK